MDPNHERARGRRRCVRRPVRGGRPDAVRRWLVSTFELQPAHGSISLAGLDIGITVPAAAERVAERYGVDALYVPLEDPYSGPLDRSGLNELARVVIRSLARHVILVVVNFATAQVYLTIPGETLDEPPRFYFGVD